jgi:FtsP/CotA-like multicopper oxidase with cupredoxin domain
VRSGLRQRFRIVNAAKARYEQLVLPGHRFTRIGSDGGMLESPELTERTEAPERPTIEATKPF